MRVTADMDRRAREAADRTGRGTRGAPDNDDIHDILAAAVAAESEPEDNCIDYDAAVKAVGEAIAKERHENADTWHFNRARRILWPLLNAQQQARKVLR